MCKISELHLKTPNQDDIDRTFSWVIRPWYLEEFAGRKKPTHESHEEFFELTLKDGTQRYFAVYLGDVHVGNAGLKYINDESCECWYYIGDESYRGKGLATRIVGLLLDYAFEILKLSIVQARIQTRNLPSIGAVRANGFVVVSSPFNDAKGQETMVYEKRA